MWRPTLPSATYSFQLAVTVIGCELGSHGSGVAFRWGERQLLLRDNVQMHLVNVGPNALLQIRLGYPVCLVCGQSRSPFSSQTGRDRFADDHHRRCGRRVEPTGFFADVVAHALTLQGCVDLREAYSLAESLRLDATRVMEMEPEDLQVLVLAQPGHPQMNALLCDPMPGGSGLLDQLVGSWANVVGAAVEICRDCPSYCQSACIDCLYTFRNAYYHRHLDRHIALERLLALGDMLEHSHPIAPRLPQNLPHSHLTNPEQDLRDLLLRAGFPEPEAQKTIALGRPLGSTTPDFFYEDPNQRYDGICIYLDGLSDRLHGKPETRERDRRIRETLKNDGYEVLEVEHSRLGDRAAMTQIFFRLGKSLLGRARAAELRANTYWFEQEPELNLSLFDSCWHPLVRALSGFGVSVEPGEDITESGQVVGSSLAIARLGEHWVHVVNANAAHWEKLVGVLTVQGENVFAAEAEQLENNARSVFEMLQDHKD